MKGLVSLLIFNKFENILLNKSEKMFFPEDIWSIIKEFTLDKAEAIKIIKHHIGWVYMLSLHQYKGIDNNVTFLKKNYSWIFDTMSLKKVKTIIRETEFTLRD